MKAQLLAAVLGMSLGSSSAVFKKPYPVPLPGEFLASSKWSDLFRAYDPETGVVCYQLFHAADTVDQIAISCVKVDDGRKAK
jgi:hypothetical protein